MYALLIVTRELTRLSNRADFGGTVPISSLQSRIPTVPGSGRKYPAFEQPDHNVGSRYPRYADADNVYSLVYSAIVPNISSRGPKSRGPSFEARLCLAAWHSHVRMRSRTSFNFQRDTGYKFINFARMHGSASGCENVPISDMS